MKVVKYIIPKTMSWLEPKRRRIPTPDEQRHAYDIALRLNELRDEAVYLRATIVCQRDPRDADTMRRLIDRLDEEVTLLRIEQMAS